jgi:uncharacterized protein (DUF2062 family)
MFKRRTPHSVLRQVRELFWPSMGWGRACRYVYHRTIRLSDTVANISKGLATGASVSFTPFLGTHFIQAGLLSWVTGSNVIASMVGTFVGNPWTFPFMWYAGYALGVWVLGLFGFEDFGELPDEMTWDILWSIIVNDFHVLFLPWLIGGYLLALLVWPLFFVIFYFCVRAAKRAQALAKAKRLKYKTKKHFYKAEHPKP